jgi:hypothetical protein
MRTASYTVIETVLKVTPVVILAGGLCKCIHLKVVVAPGFEYAKYEPELVDGSSSSPVESLE